MYSNKNLLQYFPEDKTPRDIQVDLIKKLQDSLKSDKKFICLNAPPGTGKSCLAATLAKSSDIPSNDFINFVNSYKIWSDAGIEDAYKYPKYGAAVLTVTKNLQDQYIESFKDICSFKGKINYVCQFDNQFLVDEAPCNESKKLKLECWNCNRCTYYEDRNRSLENIFSVYNYDVFLNLPSHTRRKQLLICDEASELEDIIVNFFSVDITYDNIEKLLDIEKYPRLINEDKDSKDWLSNLLDQINLRINQLKNELKIKPNQKNTKKLKALNQLFLEIQRVINYWGENGENPDAVEYIVEKVSPDKYNKNVLEGVNFTPFKVNKLASYLFNDVDKVIFLSATIIDHRKQLGDLGIEQKDYIYIESPSIFDAKKAPIYIDGNYPLTFKELSKNIPKVTEMIKNILEIHKNDKGLIHTVSFKITKYLSDNIDNDRLIYRSIGKNNQELMNEHSQTDKPTVMVSPSMSHGVDLTGDLGRFQIISKVPYPSLNSKRIKRLSKVDPQWYINKTLLTIIQMCGRCNRSETDEAVTYIVDGSIKNLLRRNWNKLPIYFRDRFK